MILADYHNLPQKPVFQNEVKMIWPFSIKLTSTPNKKIYHNVENLRKRQNESPV